MSRGMHFRTPGEAEQWAKQMEPHWKATHKKYGGTYTPPTIRQNKYGMYEFGDSNQASSTGGVYSPKPQPGGRYSEVAPPVHSPGYAAWMAKWRQQGSGNQGGFSAYSPGSAQPRQNPYAYSHSYGSSSQGAPPSGYSNASSQQTSYRPGQPPAQPRSPESLADLIAFDRLPDSMLRWNAERRSRREDEKSLGQPPGPGGGRPGQGAGGAATPGTAQPVQDPYAESNAYGEAGVSGGREKRGQPRYPAHWYENMPTIGTMDMRPLPGGGMGSTTTANWIKRNMELDRQRGLPGWQGRDGEAGQRVTVARGGKGWVPFAQREGQPARPKRQPQNASLPRQKTPEGWASAVNERLRNEFDQKYGEFKPQDASATQVYIGEDGLAYVRRNRGLGPWQDKTPQLYKDQPPGAWPPGDPTAPQIALTPPGAGGGRPGQDAGGSATPGTGYSDEWIRQENERRSEEYRSRREEEKRLGQPMHSEGGGPMLYRGEDGQVYEQHPMLPRTPGWEQYATLYGGPEQTATNSTIPANEPSGPPRPPQPTGFQTSWGGSPQPFFGGQFGGFQQPFFGGGQFGGFQQPFFGGGQFGGFQQPSFGGGQFLMSLLQGLYPGFR